MKELLLLVLWSLDLAQAATWIVTSYYSTATFSAYTVGSITQPVSVATLEMVPTQTPLPPPITVVTTVYYGVTTIQSILPASAGKRPPRVSDKPNFTNTDYVVQLTYTQPPSCTYSPHKWTVTVDLNINFDYKTGTAFSLTGNPIATSTYTHACDCGTVGYLPIVTAVLQPTDVDDNYLRDLSRSYEPRRLTSCATDPTSALFNLTRTLSTPTLTGTALRTSDRPGSGSRLAIPMFAIVLVSIVVVIGGSLV